MTLLNPSRLTPQAPGMKSESDFGAFKIDPFYINPPEENTSGATSSSSLTVPR